MEIKYDQYAIFTKDFNKKYPEKRIHAIDLKSVTGMFSTHVESPHREKGLTDVVIAVLDSQMSMQISSEDWSELFHKWMIVR